MRTDSISPNQEYRIVEYQFDHGAHGYSRMFWAIVPANKENINLKEYILPDGYKTLGWTSDNKAVIEKWEPYYYKDKEVTLKTGDQFNGVTLELSN
ncbi:hypothetical protein C8E01_106284 [Pontibacter virosus]|uniref:Uncharacterized protein n=2 Tax=Pontibacter virosus TaxID=1765052 RepID=A0A2U1AX27_9BACT|nr:hypothetical protein C8E01_106284 [Pontibacter virosus]